MDVIWYQPLVEHAQHHADLPGCRLRADFVERRLSLFLFHLVRQQHYGRRVVGHVLCITLWRLTPCSPKAWPRLPITPGVSSVSRRIGMRSQSLR